MPAVTESDLLKIEVVAPDGDFSAWVRWNGPAVERFRGLVGDEIAATLLRRLGTDLVESIEDVLARREHPPGRCYPDCPHHVNGDPASSTRSP
jgi:hypothetical protein